MLRYLVPLLALAIVTVVCGVATAAEEAPFRPPDYRGEPLGIPGGPGGGWGYDSGSGWGLDSDNNYEGGGHGGGNTYGGSKGISHSGSGCGKHCSVHNINNYAVATVSLCLSDGYHSCDGPNEEVIKRLAWGVLRNETINIVMSGYGEEAEELQIIRNLAEDARKVVIDKLNDDVARLTPYWWDPFAGARREAARQYSDEIGALRNGFWTRNSRGIVLIDRDYPNSGDNWHESTYRFDYGDMPDFQELGKINVDMKRWDTAG